MLAALTRCHLESGPLDPASSTRDLIEAMDPPGLRAIAQHGPHAMLVHDDLCGSQDSKRHHLRFPRLPVSDSPKNQALPIPDQVQKG